MHAEQTLTLLPFPSGGAPRSGGVHLSGLLKSMALDYGFLDKQYADDLKLVEVAGSGETWWANLDEDSQLRMSVGLAWEAWYLPQVPGVVHQPGEMEVEGIYMTCDGQSLDTIMVERQRRHCLAIHEVKTTSKSTNTVGDLNFFNPKNWMWLTQTMCYVFAAQTTVAYLHILYLYGDYSRPFRMQRHVWRLQFTDEELELVWSRVRDYRDEKAAAGLLEL